MSEKSSEQGGAMEASNDRDTDCIAKLVEQAERYEEKVDSTKETMDDEAARLTNWGCFINTNSDHCLASINAFYDQILNYSYTKYTTNIYDACFYDNKCVLSNVFAAHLVEHAEPTFSRNYLLRAEEFLNQATDYERAVFEAVSYSMKMDKDYDVAINLYSKILQKWPQDLASLKRAQMLCVEGGRPKRSIDLVHQVKDANQKAHYFHGMHAFSLLELGEFQEAEAAARAALEINNRDFLAQHCVGNVLQQKCRFGDAVKFINSNTWEACSIYMRTYNWSLVAACYLEGGAYKNCYDIYEKYIEPEFQKAGHFDLQMREVYVNVLGLLMRIFERGLALNLDRPPKSIRLRFFKVEESLKDRATWHKERHLDLFSIWALRGNAENSKALAKCFINRLGKVKPINKQNTDLKFKGLKLVNAMQVRAAQAITILGYDFEANEYKEVMGASDEYMQVLKEFWWCSFLNSDHVQLGAGWVQLLPLYGGCLTRGRFHFYGGFWRRLTRWRQMKKGKLQPLLSPNSWQAAQPRRPTCWSNPISHNFNENDKLTWILHHHDLLILCIVDKMLLCSVAYSSYEQWR